MASTNPLPVGGSAPLFLSSFSPVWMATLDQLEFPGGQGFVGIPQTNQSLTVQRAMMCGLFSAGGGKGTRSPNQQSVLQVGPRFAAIMWDPGGAT